ncbi:hypothetical protein A6R68_22189, partial [Neotoma lepida]
IHSFHFNSIKKRLSHTGINRPKAGRRDSFERPKIWNVVTLALHRTKHQFYGQQKTHTLKKGEFTKFNTDEIKGRMAEKWSSEMA